jgi:hypothetical protein
MSDVSRALEDLAEIHASLAAREVYRGWRSAPVALSGMVGLIAAVVLTIRHTPSAPTAAVAADFLRTWLIVAIGACLAGCSEIVWRYLKTSRSIERRRTQVVMRQFLPGPAAGALIAVALVRVDPAAVVTVPGIWAIAFALGIYSARPCLPALSVWAAAYYGLAGLVLLTRAIVAPGEMPSPWTVGATFGVGQVLGAFLLYAALERGIERTDGDEEA